MVTILADDPVAHSVDQFPAQGFNADRFRHDNHVDGTVRALTRPPSLNSPPRPTPTRLRSPLPTTLHRSPCQSSSARCFPSMSTTIRQPPLPWVSCARSMLTCSSFPSNLCCQVKFDNLSSTFEHRLAQSQLVMLERITLI